MTLELSGDIPAHHLYVCHSDSLSLRSHLALRSHLINHPGRAASYATLKRKLAAQDPYNMELYVQNKTKMICEILIAEGFSQEQIQEITSQNSIKPKGSV